MNSGITWLDLFQDAKDKFGHDLDETVLIRRANRLIDDIKLITNLPTQIRTDYVSYCYQFDRYKLPTDYKTEGIISLRYDNRVDNNRDRVYVRDDEPFDWTNDRFRFYTPEKWNELESSDMATIWINKGVEALWLKNGRADQTTQEISDCDDVDLWTGSAGATNLTEDDKVKAEGDYSINYDISAATAPTLTLTLTTAVDLSEYVDNGIIRLFKWLPSAPTSITIKMGESASAYYYQTITTQSDGASFDVNQSNELEFKFKDATLTGSPDMTASVYFAITLTFGTATTDTDFRIDNIVAYKPEQLTLEYYSFYMVLNENSEWAEYLTDGIDESVNILPEWREPFIKGLLVEEMEKLGDDRKDDYKKDYLIWLKEIQKRFSNRSKRTGSFYY